MNRFYQDKERLAAEVGLLRRYRFALAWNNN